MDKTGTKNLVLDLTIGATCLSIICLLWSNNLLTAFLLLIVCCASLHYWHRKREMVIFITASIAGPMAEIICIKFGVWSYANPTFLDIPLWLPLAWGLGVTLVYRISKRFAHFEKGSE